MDMIGSHIATTGDVAEDNINRKNLKVALLTQMKHGWELKTLGDLYDITSSKRVFQSDWTSTGIPFYRAREIVKLSIQGRVDNDLFISEEMYNRYSVKYGIPKENDIMVTGVGTLGICYVVKSEDKFYFKDGNIIWLKDRGIANSKFVEYAFKSEILRQQIDDSVGATVGTFTIVKAKSTLIPIPSLSEQQRIVAILDEAFAAIDKAKANAERNLKNARELFENNLLTILSSKKWRVVSLGEACDGVEYGSSSKSSQSGEIAVLRMGNIQNGKFDWTSLVYSNNAKDNEKYLLSYDDVLFNRTNSPELVGKTAIYKGERPAIFAGYLIRIRRKEEMLDAEYLNYYLNSQIAMDYGKTVVTSSVNQANINGAKLKTYPIPLPSLSEQRDIVQQLHSMRAKTKKLEGVYQRKIENLEELKKSLLQKAFSGELTTSKPIAKVVKLPVKYTTISAIDLQAGIVAFALQRHLEASKANTFRHVKAEKIVHLVEQILNIDLERNPVKDVAGPNDFPHAKKVEFRAEKVGYFNVRKTEIGYEYTPGNQIQSIISKTQMVLDTKVDQLEWLIDLLVPMTTQQAEIIATVYAAWNNLIIYGQNITDEAIVAEAREDWHPDKLKIEREKFFNAISWMNKVGLVPTGNGKQVSAKAVK